jgi:general stress protein YciG
MQCPNCQRVIPDKKALEMISEKLILQRSAAILGSRGRGESKARDPEKMRAAGKLGGRPPKGEQQNNNARLGGLAKARNRAEAEKRAKATQRKRKK